MTAGISLNPGKTGAHGAPLQQEPNSRLNGFATSSPKEGNTLFPMRFTFNDE